MTAEDRIAALDARFVGIYEETRRRLLDAQKRRGLILVNEGHMLLYHGGGAPRRINGLRPPLYNKLKTLSHVPLSIYCMLIGCVGGDPFPPSVRDSLRDYRKRLARSAADFDTTEEVASGLLPHGIDILARCLEFLDGILADGRVSGREFGRFCGANVADINATFGAATRVQLDACHTIAMDLKDNVLSPEAWDGLCVVVVGPHMAHKGNNILQYFSRLLHTPKYADKRVVYFEGEDEQAALDLLATAILDRQASRSIFDDESRLHRDVLADATTQYLEELLPG